MFWYIFWIHDWLYVSPLHSENWRLEMCCLWQMSLIVLLCFGLMMLYLQSIVKLGLCLQFYTMRCKNRLRRFLLYHLPCFKCKYRYLFRTWTHVSAEDNKYNLCFVWRYNENSTSNPCHDKYYQTQYNKDIVFQN